MLLSFTVTNFKSLKDTQTLSMVGTSLKGPHKPFALSYPGEGSGVLPCAIIYGANASGKSNLLDAFIRMKNMVFASYTHTQKYRRLPYHPFLLDDEAAQQETVFDISFIQSGIRYDYGFSYNEEKICEEWLFSYPEGRRRKMFERKDLEIEFGSSMKGAKKVLAGFLSNTSLFLTVGTQNNHEELSAVSNFFEKTYTSNKITVETALLNQSFSKEIIDKRSISFLEAIGTGICQYRVDSSDLSEEKKKTITEVIKLFSKFGELGVTENDFDEKDHQIKLGHKNSEDKVIFFSGDMESAGTRRLLLMLNKIFKALDEGYLAIIDEIDASLHTYAVEIIVGLFLDPVMNAKGAQLLATTHDTNLLNTEFVRRDEIWFVEKNRVGESNYFSLAEIKSRKDEVFEKSYLQGRYGAIPARLQNLLFS